MIPVIEKMCELENGDIESRLPIRTKAAIMESLGGVRLQSKHRRFTKSLPASFPSPIKKF